MTKLTNLINKKMKKLSYPNPGHRGLPGVHGGSRPKIIKGTITGLPPSDLHRIVKESVDYSKRGVSVPIEGYYRGTLGFITDVLDKIPAKFLTGLNMISADLDPDIAANNGIWKRDDGRWDWGGEITDGLYVNSKRSLHIANYFPLEGFESDWPLEKVLIHEVGHNWEAIVLKQPKIFEKLGGMMEDLRQASIKAGTGLFMGEREKYLAQYGLRTYSVNSIQEFIADSFMVFWSGSSTKQQRSKLKKAYTESLGKKYFEETIGFEYV